MTFKMTVEPVLRKKALERTIAMMGGAWLGDNKRIANAKRFIKKAKKSDVRRRIEKASRKRNRK